MQLQYSKLNRYMIIYVISFPFSGVGLTLNSVPLTNNSIVTNTDITSTVLLVCTTTYTSCCTGFGNPDTQWYFPNGSEVMNQPTSLPYRRTRGQSPGRVNLIRNSDTTTTGIFHCDIPDDSGALQSLYVGIYDSGTGESCTLREWFVICEEIAGTQDKGSAFQLFMCNSIGVQH